MSSLVGGLSKFSAKTRRSLTTLEDGGVSGNGESVSSSDECVAGLCFEDFYKMSICIVSNISVKQW